MRRAVSLAVVSAILVVGGVAPALAREVPGTSSARGGSATVWQQRLFGWLFGSSTNPLVDPTFCGEVVDGVFFLNVAGQPTVEVDCEIPTGTWLVGSPGGSIAAFPAEDPATDAEILAARDEEFQRASDPSATLDGKPLDVESGFARTGVYTFPVEEGSLLKEFDPTFAESDQARAATAGWVVRIAPLSPGTYELVLSDKFDGEPFTATFHITVTPRHR